MAQRTLGLILAGLISGAAVAALVLAPPNSQTLPHSSVSEGKAEIGGPFTLTDQTGKRVSDKDYAGKTLLVFFGFTHCPDICPSALQVMSAALDKLGPKADNIVPLFITFDALRDTPEKLAAYLKSFNPRIVGLTGTDKELADIAKAYRVFVQKVQDEHSKTEYSYDHASIFYIMGKDGTFITHVPQTNSVEDLVTALEKATA